MDVGSAIGGALHCFTVGDYHRMAEAGVFDGTRRVELIRGVIVDMPAIGTPHRWTVTRLNRQLNAALGARAIVAIQSSIRLDDHSEPEPDVALLRPDADETRHPGPGDVLLLIEVADNTLARDREKVALYAESGIVEYWIVNLQDRVIEIYRRPSSGGYAQRVQVTSGRIACLAFPDQALEVDQALPPA